MAKHDLKAQEIQVELLDNLIQMFITSKVAIKMASSDIDLSDPLSLITLEVLQEYVGGGEPLISLWDGGSTPLNYYRSHAIDGVEYLFRSLVSDNTSEPTLESGAWSKNGLITGLIPLWSSLTTYAEGDYVRRSQTVDGTLHNFAFKSKSNGNTNNNPLNFDGLFWEFLGENRGDFVDGTVYAQNDVVTGDDSDGNAVFISLSNGNESPLTSTGSTWQLIGGGASEIPTLQQVLESGFETNKFIQFKQEEDPDNYQLSIDSSGVYFTYLGSTGPSISAIERNILLIGVPEVGGVAKVQVSAQINILPAIEDDEAITLAQANGLYGKTIQVYTEVDLLEEYEGSYYLSVSIPSGKVPVAIQRVQSGQTYYIPVNINAGILGGFSNNSTQTITIYFI